MEQPLAVGWAIPTITAIPIKDFNLQPILMNVINSNEKRLENIEKRLEIIEKLLLEIQQSLIKVSRIETSESQN
jgi:hypothetical protein